MLLYGGANRLAKSQLLPQTSDNDQNWAGGSDLKVTVFGLIA